LTALRSGTMLSLHSCRAVLRRLLSFGIASPTDERATSN
jgi:hypothetical protein